MVFKPARAILNRNFSTIIMSKPKIAVCQFTATNNKHENLRAVEQLVARGTGQGGQMIFLPEASDFVAHSHEESKSLAETLEGYVMSKYKELAQKYNVWLSIGGFHELRSNNKMYNTHIILDNSGQIKATYRKLHLFDVDLQNVKLKESDYVLKGQEIIPPLETPVGLLGLGICYDLRFPELSIILRKMGTNILTFPSAFTAKTGQAHWEVLLRSRAIENQCYVVAAAQYGRHNEKRISFGQAMIVDPWGEIIAECPKYTGNTPSNESVAVAHIDLERLKELQYEMPVFSHRRDDMYQLLAPGVKTDLTKQDSFMFADKVIPSSTVFFFSNYSYAFTNIKCVVPGHVLIATIRSVPRLENLLPNEITDFFQTTLKVQQAVEKAYNATSSTVCIQDGRDAGQTLPHVHCHVLPRTPGDFENNDDIYMKLAKHDKPENVNNGFRSLEEMENEADLLRTYFNGDSTLQFNS